MTPMTISEGPWAPFSPTADEPWDLRKVAHLHRRAGFGANRAELLRDLADGPSASVDRLFSPPEATADERGVQAALRHMARTSSSIDLLKVAWLNRILRGPDPLCEKLTLFWHGHFATSVKKVASVALMDAQNETLRERALGPFDGLLRAMIADPAMLVWLDGGDSRAERPNENFAREFLELFTLGTGPYGEADVRAAARAFAGWTRGEGDSGVPSFRIDPGRVGGGVKTFLGRTGPWGPPDIVRITLERPEAATFLARKLYRAFVGEAVEPAPELIAPLAAALRESGYSVRRAIGVILRSRHFYGAGSLRQRVKSPVEFSAGLVRALEVDPGAMNPLALSSACDAQGQELFSPPNVKGWDGGPAWINSATLLQRGNWAADVAWGRREDGVGPFDAPGWCSRHGLDTARAAEALIDLLLQGDLDVDARAMVLRAARGGGVDGLRRALQLIANCPEFHLA